MRPSSAILAGLLCALTLGACQPASKAGGAGTTPDAGAAFLARNAKTKGVISLPDGVQYKVLTSGPMTGPRPKPNDDIKFNYELRLLDGHVVQSSWENGEPMVSQLRNLIPGWVEVMQLMHPGDTWEVYLPPKMAYGEQGNPEIPPNSTLIFKIELIDVLPANDSVGAG